MNSVLIKSLSNEPITFLLKVRGYKDENGKFCDKIGEREGYDWETLLQKEIGKIYSDMTIAIKDHDKSSVSFDASFKNRFTKASDLYVRLNHFLNSTKSLIPASLEIKG